MITFKGPYHISQLGNLGLNGKRGVYIWGFAFRFQEEQCHSPVDLNKENILSNIGDREIVFPDDIKFIPYYVGQGDLYNRINNHSNFRTGSSAKYTRFSMLYMNNFFTGNGFPIYNTRKNRVNNVITFHKAKHGRLGYYNSRLVLSSIYPGMTPLGKANHWPIYKQCFHGTPLPDTLDFLRRKCNNFFFCYAETDSSIDLKDAEASTFWALKGLTISKIKENYNQIPVYGSANCLNLFRYPSPAPCTISSPTVFPGNY